MTSPAIEGADEARLKHHATVASLATNLALSALKLSAAVLTGSVGLFSEAAHSSIDVVASALVYVSVRAASVPPDEDHPYGHGKIESLAGFGESILLLLTDVYIVVEAVPRLVDPHPIRNAPAGLFVMGASAGTSLLVGLYISRIGDRTASKAIRTNGRHLLVDVWSSAGVFIAIAITYFTGFKQADPVMALILAVWIARVAVRLAADAVQELIDRRLSNDDYGKVQNVLNSDPDVLSYHRLRTRSSGKQKFVEVHVVVPRDWTVVRAHETADELEKQIAAAVPPATVVIHVDPFDPSKAT